MGRGSISSPADRFFPLLRPEHIFSHYIPATGCLSYAAFAFHVYHPRSLGRLFPSNYLPITNCLLFNAHIGAGIYLYNRPHMARLNPVPRVAFSAYGAILLNFGSILLWATSKTILPTDTHSWLRTLLALTTSFGILAIGREYVRYIDSLVDSDDEK